jgi:hypothetical protein
VKNGTNGAPPDVADAKGASKTAEAASSKAGESGTKPPTAAQTAKPSTATAPARQNLMGKLAGMIPGGKK